MPVSSEALFTQTLRLLQDCLDECILTAEACFEIQWTDFISDIRHSTGSFYRHIIADLHLVHERTYPSGVKVGYIIAADEYWNPLVFITYSNQHPLVFAISHDLDGYDQARNAMVAALGRAAALQE